MKPSVRLIGVTTPLVKAYATENLTGGFDEAFFPVNKGLEEPLDLIEYAGRWDYGPKSISKMGDRDIIRRWIGSGEESMLEMVNVVFLIECSRVVSHELVRHRIASYQQESQRYVRYDEEEPDDLFYVPDELDPTEALILKEAYEEALRAYKKLKTLGVKSQLARYVLPNGTRTRVVANMNLREWRHVLKLRMHRSAQPEMRAIAWLIWELLNTDFPEVFGDIPAWLEEGERAVR